MLNRRQFLAHSSLVAVGALAPQFLANTARAADDKKDTVLVVLEMNGGNDGLNTVIPYADDLYHKARPTLRFTDKQVVKVDDHVGLHPGMRSLEPMLKEGKLAVVQGVGYPNPDRSHFESMDIWQLADPKRKLGNGWIGRSVADLQDNKGNVPVMQLGASKLPVALQGAPSGVVSINNTQPYRLELGTENAAERKERRKLLEDLAKPKDNGDDLLQFVQRRQVQTYSTLDRIEEVLKAQTQNNIFIQSSGAGYAAGSLVQRMNLIANLIVKDFGVRVFYAMIDGFDTHSGQGEPHQNLLREVADSIAHLFQTLGDTHSKRVAVMTFSEFGRRVNENGSRGTDHGAASCLFVAGPGVKGGAVGKHPSLSDLDAGDLKHHTDFRRVYATLLDNWLGIDSKRVLGDKFEHLELIKKA
jgi:uncharacterized protein (DUF1501 family)